MPIVHMAQSYQDAADRGKNVHLYRDSYLHTTITRWSDGQLSLNLNPQIPVEEQPKNGYEYSPVLWLYETHHGLCIHEREYGNLGSVAGQLVSLAASAGRRCIQAQSHWTP